MAKRFDCEDEPNDFMEMPCRCDCGKWFDLTDGHRSDEKPGRVVCRECKEIEALFHYGDMVMFTDEYIVNGRTRAHYGDRATIVARGHLIKGYDLKRDKTSVRVEGKKYALYDVPIAILEKLY